MTVLSNPDKAKTRELREAVAAYQDHIGNHRGAALVRAQPDNFTEWSGYAHQLVTVMDKVSLKGDLPKGIEGMLSYSREKAAEFAQNNRELALNNERFAATRDSWGKRAQSDNVIDRRDGFPPEKPSWGRDILDRGERGFAKIVAALITLLQQFVGIHTRAAYLCRKKPKHILRDKYVYLPGKRARPHGKQGHLARGLRIHLLPHFAQHMLTRVLQIPAGKQKNKADCQHKQCRHR